MSRIVVYPLTLIVLLATSGCESKKPGESTPNRATSDDLRRDVGKAFDTAGDYSQQKKEEFQKELEAGLAKLDAEVVKLREKGRDLKDDAKIKWERQMADLETKREAVRAKLAEVGNATAEAWTDIHKGAKSAWEDLDNALREAAKHY